MDKISFVELAEAYVAEQKDENAKIKAFANCGISYEKVRSSPLVKYAENRLYSEFEDSGIDVVSILLDLVEYGFSEIDGKEIFCINDIWEALRV